jgi:hypothetical protein
MAAPFGEAGVRVILIALLAFVLTACASPGGPRAPINAGPAPAPAGVNWPALETARAAIAAVGASSFMTASQETDDKGILRAVVRHPRSGLVCRWGQDQTTRVVVFRGAAIPEGDNIGCDMSFAGGPGAVTLYATRYPVATTLEEQRDSALAAMLQRFPGAGRLPEFGRTSPLWARFSAPAFLQANLAARGALQQQGQDLDLFTGVAVAMVDGWVIKMRLTAPIRVGPVQADAYWAQALYDVMRTTPGV